MFAVAIFFAFVLALCAGLIVAAFRRAIPLAMAGAAGWLAFAAANELGVALLAGLAALVMTAYALDELALWDERRSMLIAAEAIAGMSLATTLAFAVFYSAEVRGSGLVIALAASAFIALGATLRFRRGV